MGGSEQLEFTEDDDSALGDQSQLIQDLQREIAALKQAHELAAGDLKRSEEKLETYRVTIKTKNDQIAALKASRDEKIAAVAQYDTKLAAAEEKAIGLQVGGVCACVCSCAHCFPWQSKLDASYRSLQDWEAKSKKDREAHEKELREVSSKSLLARKKQQTLISRPQATCAE